MIANNRYAAFDRIFNKGFSQDLWKPRAADDIKADHTGFASTGRHGIFQLFAALDLLDLMRVEDFFKLIESMLAFTQSFLLANANLLANRKGKEANFQSEADDSEISEDLVPNVADVNHCQANGQ